MSDRYYLKGTWEDEWTEVTKEKWILVERLAGFHPKGIRSDSPDYMQACVTRCFSSGSVVGKIVTKDDSGDQA